MAGLWEADHYRFFSDGWDVCVVLEMEDVEDGNWTSVLQVSEDEVIRTFVCDGSGNVLSEIVVGPC